MNRKLIASICCGLLLTTLAYPQTIVPGGDVSGTWTTAGSPYLVEGEITLPSEQTLTIEPGVTVEFQGHYKFIVNGILEAVGTEDDSITFTAVDPDSGWHGLRLYDLNTQADTSQLAYCILTYGITTADTTNPDDIHGGAIFCRNSSILRIQHCLISDNKTVDIIGEQGYPGSPGSLGFPGGPGQNVSTGNGGAIYCVLSDILLAHNVITNNRTGDAMGGDGGDGGSETAPYWYFPAYGTDGGAGGDGFSGRGGAIYLENCNPSLIQNNFHCNRTGDAIGGVGGAGGSASAPYNSAWGGHGGSGGNGFVGPGGVIYAKDSNPALTNNLFAYNSSGAACGGNGGNGGDVDATDDEFPGNGGDGGDGYSGDAATLCCEDSSPTIEACTHAENECGEAVAGSGGIGGIALYNPGSGANGSAGTAVSGDYMVTANTGSTLYISNSIYWNQGWEEILLNQQVSYSCIQGGYEGIGNIDSDPLFVSTTQGIFFLSQLNAGQMVQSPCVDAGDPASSMIVGTTRTDAVQDDGNIDMGYHYALFDPPPVSVSLIPENPPITIPATGGSFDYSVIVHNNLQQQTNCQLWYMIQQPDSSWYDPTIGPVNITMSPLQSLSRSKTQSIPERTPPGNYNYEIRIGRYPEEVWAFDSVEFTKLGLNWAVEFDGFSGYGVAPFNELYSMGTNDFTVEALIKLSADPFIYPTYKILWNSGEGIQQWMEAYTLQVMEMTRTARFEAAYGNSGQQHWTLNSTTIIVPEVWYHIAGVRQEGTVILYVDGVPEDVLTDIYGTVYTNDALYINGPIPACFPGAIDEVRVWRDARSEEEINEYMLTELTGNEDNLVAYFQLNEGIGNTFADSSPTMNNGTLHGGYEWVLNNLFGIDGDQRRIEGDSNIPTEFGLSQNYPNPFNPLTTIEYAMPEDAHVTLTIYNLLGRQVARLVDGYREAGYHNVIFDAVALSSGLYLYRIEIGDFSAVQKMVLVK